MNAILLVLSLSFTPRLPVYPIDPRPLRMLVEESEYIIVGYVQKTVPYKVEDDGATWHDARAIIEVREVLQGKINDKIIEVPFTPVITCPTPPDYTDSTLVLAFLDKKKGVYSTHALSYGAKTLEATEIGLYKLRITEIQKIQQIAHKKERFAQTVEWLVKCAEHPVTRWEGTYELSPQSDFMSFYKSSAQQEFGLYLNKEQRERLRTALFANIEQEQAGYVDLGLVDLIHEDYTEEIDKLLIENLKNINGNSFWFADAYMDRLLSRTSNPRAKEIEKEFKEIYFKNYIIDRKPEKMPILRNLIEEFLVVIE